MPIKDRGMIVYILVTWSPFAFLFSLPDFHLENSEDCVELKKLLLFDHTVAPVVTGRC
jgi:hypothetical protein